eukprot:15815_1
MSMNQSLMGTSVRDIGRNIQKLCRQNKKLERYLKNIGTSSDTILFRTTIKNEIHETTALVKSLLSSIQDLKSQETSNTKLERLEKQFLEQYTTLSSLTKTLKNRLETIKPYDNSRHTASSSTNNTKQPLINTINTYSANPGPGTYDLSNMNEDNNPFNNPDLPMDEYENHPPIPSEQEEPDLMQSQQFIPQFNAHLEELEDREEAIHQMAEDLTELNSMYKDLSGLVDEQGETIVVLSSHVENARDEVKSGVEHLDVASKHQRKYRKKLCIMMMVILLLALVLT